MKMSAFFWWWHVCRCENQLKGALSFSVEFTFPGLLRYTWSLACGLVSTVIGCSALVTLTRKCLGSWKGCMNERMAGVVIMEWIMIQWMKYRCEATWRLSVIFWVVCTGPDGVQGDSNVFMKLDIWQESGCGGERATCREEISRI